MMSTSNNDNDTGSTSSVTSPVSADEFLEYQIATCLWTFIAPCLIVLGTTGNLLSLAVLRGCTSLRHSSVGFSLSALAVVDTSVLVVVLMRQWLVYTVDIDLRCVGGTVGCKLHFFLSYFLSHLSSWTVVVVTVERALFVGMPIVAKLMCTRSRVITTWSTIALLLMVLNSLFFVIATYPFYGQPIDIDDDTSIAVNASSSVLLDSSLSSSVDQLMTDDENNSSCCIRHQTNNNHSSSSSPTLIPARFLVSTPICYVHESYEPFLLNVWLWIDFAVLAIVPFSVVAAANVVIAVCVVRAVRFRLQHLQQRQQTSSAAVVTGDNTAASPPTSTTLTTSLVVAPSVGTNNTNNSNNNNPGNRRDGGRLTSKYSSAISSSTLMLFSVSLAFLLTTTPNVVYFVKSDQWINNMRLDEDPVNKAHTEARIRLTYAVTCLLLYANNSINFALYCIAGTRFRRAAGDMFRRAVGRSSAGPPVGTTAAQVAGGWRGAAGTRPLNGDGTAAGRLRRGQILLIGRPRTDDDDKTTTQSQGPTTSSQ